MRQHFSGYRSAVLLVVLMWSLGMAGAARAQESRRPSGAVNAIAAPISASVQEEAEHEAHEEDFKRHKILFLYGTGWVPQGDPSEERTGVMVVPTLGVDYEFWLTEKVAIGVQNDFELSQYVIETHDGEEIDREFAYVLVGAVILEPVPNLSLFFGPGGEFEKNHNFFVFRVGGEYGIPIRNHWDVGFSVTYDYKDAYDAVAFGISFGKRF